jgi:hypothetical protein
MPPDACDKHHCPSRESLRRDKDRIASLRPAEFTRHDLNSQPGFFHDGSLIPLPHPARSRGGAVILGIALVCLVSWTAAPEARRSPLGTVGRDIL